MIDVARALKSAVQSGEVVFGLKAVRDAVKRKTARLVVLANNCPDTTVGDGSAVKIHRYAGTNADLGAACGKPFSIAAVAVLDPGESNILSV